ncbi:MAG: energy-coupling factor transporter transmembrane protein EcfT [Methanomicrobiales archaeon]|jgi:energy-coupling factor transport system permease protein|nr:energy-coupling factor transporter transmembrane protein EcfT [Methanomicrobiales archaeon]
MNEVLTYIKGDSFLHRLNPLTKIAIAILIIVMSVISLHLGMLLLILAIVALIAGVSRIGSTLAQQIPLFAMLTVFITILTVLTVTSGDVLYNGLIRITTGGITSGLILASRFIIMISVVHVVVVSTAPGDLVRALRAMHMPVDYSLMMLIALRFIPGLQIEGKRIQEAQLSRGYNPGTGFMGKVRSVAPMLVPLVANSLARTRVIGYTLEMRGYRNKHNAVIHLPFGLIDGIALFCTFALLILFLMVTFS